MTYFKLLLVMLLLYILNCVILKLFNNKNYAYLHNHGKNIG